MHTIQQIVSDLHFQAINHWHSSTNYDTAENMKPCSYLMTRETMV